jgi:hypothetical protein
MGRDAYLELGKVRFNVLKDTSASWSTAKRVSRKPVNSFLSRTTGRTSFAGSKPRPSCSRFFGCEPSGKGLP